MSIDPTDASITAAYGNAADWRAEDWSAAGQKACANGSQGSRTQDDPTAVLSSLKTGNVFALTLCYKHKIFTPKYIGGFFLETFHDDANKNIHWARAFYIRRIAHDGRS